MIYGMSVAIVLIVFKLFLSNNGNYSRKRIEYFLILSGLVLVLFYGLRAPFSSDYKGYVEWFDAMKDSSFKDIILGNSIPTDFKYEPVLFLLFRLIHCFSDSSIVMELVCGMLLVLPLFRIIKVDKSPSSILSVLLVLVFSVAASFNVMRSMLAFAYVVGNIDLAERRNLKGWIILILCCATVHTAVLFIFPIYFIITKDFGKAKKIIIVAGIALLFFTFDKLSLYFSSFTRFYRYFEFGGARVSAIDIGPAFIPPVLLWLLYIFLHFNKDKEIINSGRTSEYYDLVAIVAIEFNFLQYQIPLMSRYTSFFNMILIIALPKALYEYKGNNNTIFFIKCIIILGLIVYAGLICQNYAFIWNY